MASVKKSDWSGLKSTDEPSLSCSLSVLSFLYVFEYSISFEMI